MPSRSASPMPPAFRYVAWSNLFAQFSEQIALAAAPLAAVLLLSAGPAETGWLQTAQTLPFLLLSIPMGLAVDRASRRTLMVGSEALRALSLGLVVLLFVSQHLSLVSLAALGFVGAIGTVCYSVAAPALVPGLVPRSRLGEANRVLELARSAAYAGGPALGGAVVGWTGASTAYVLATVLSILAAMLLAGLPEEPAAEPSQRDLLLDLRDGARFIARHDLLRPVLVTAIVFNTSWFVLQAVYTAYAVQNLGLDATEIGLTLGTYGAGMIVGAWAAPALGRWLPLGSVIVLGPLGGFAAACVMLLTLWVPTIYLVALGFFLFGAGPMLWAISTMTVRQAVTPAGMLGRVSALIVTATFGARPIGAAIGAFAATRFGVAACLFVATGGFLIQLLVILVSQVPKLRGLPEPTPTTPA